MANNMATPRLAVTRTRRVMDQEPRLGLGGAGDGAIFAKDKADGGADNGVCGKAAEVTAVLDA